MPTKKPKPEKSGLYANIHAKQERIANGSGEKMRKPGDKGAPTGENFARAEEGKKPAAKKPAAKKTAAPSKSGKT